MSNSKLIETTRTYYDSKDADEFYFTIWGGEDIHIGIYENSSEPITTASHRTVQNMAALLPNLTAETRILDLGAGYGGAARFLAKTFGCKITCLNLSETENQRNIEKTTAAGLTHLISIVAGNFENIPFDAESFDVVWSEDAFLHSAQKADIFSEIDRVLKKGGHLIFTDPMQADDCPEGVLQPILDRIHLQAMGSAQLYQTLATENQLVTINTILMPNQLINHYQAVLNEMNRHSDTLMQVCSSEFISRMKSGLEHWINGGKNGFLNWGILHFKKN